MGKYDDILAMSRPAYSAKHPPMARADRAKQFMPFASLRSFDDVIDDRQTLRVRRRQPSEDERETMDDCLRRIGEALSEGVQPEVSLLLFERDTARSDETGEWGRYRRDLLCGGREADRTRHTRQRTPHLQRSSVAQPDQLFLGGHAHEGGKTLPDGA